MPRLAETVRLNTDRNTENTSVVATQLAQAPDLLMWPAAIVERDHVHHDRARAQRRALRALARHLQHQPRHHHLQSAPGAGRGQIEIDAVRAALRRQDALAVEDLAS